MKKKILTSVFLAIFTAATLGLANAPGTEISANEIEYNSATQTVVAMGNVVIKHDGGTAKAERAVYNTGSSQGTLNGSVTAQQGNVTLACEQLDLFNQKHLLASGGNVVVTRGGDRLSADQIEYFDDRQFAQTKGGWAKLSKDDGSTIVAHSINYDMKQGQAEAEGEVNIEAPARNLVAAGDYAVYVDERSGRDASITLMGNAWAVQEGNKINGQKLTFKTGKGEGQASGKVVMEIPPTPKANVTEKPKE